MANDAKPVDIKVKTTAEGTGVLSQVTGFLQKIKEGGGAASKAIEGMASVIKGPLAAAAAVIGTVAGAFTTLTKAVEEYAASQEKVAGLDAAAAQRGLLSDDFRERLQELASQLQDVTAIADDEWYDVLKRLIQFGSTPESIGMDVEAVKNLAGIIGDVSSAANLYSRALQGNFEMFGRYGIAVRDAGTQTEKLRDLQEQLAQRGGGQLEARAQSLNGQWRALKNNTSDLLESIGGLIARTGIVQAVIGGLSNVTSAWAEILGGTVEQLDGFNNKVGDTEKALARYRVEMEAVAKLSEAIAAAHQKEVAALKAKQSALDEVADAQMALDLARVDQAEQAGKISSVGAIRARSSIRKAAARSKFDREQATDLATLSSAEREAADQGKLLADVAKERARLERRVAIGSTRETSFNVANERKIELMRELDRLKFSPGDNMGALISGVPKGQFDERARIAEIHREIAVMDRVQFPAGLADDRAALMALREREAALGPKAAAATAALGQARADIGPRMATRETVFGLNSQRDDITAAMAVDNGTAEAAKRQLDAVQRGAAGVGSQVSGALESVERALGKTHSVVARFEKRLDALEASQKNALNR